MLLAAAFAFSFLAKPVTGHPPVPKPVPLQPLPLKRGFYAREDVGCATRGSFARYSRLLTVQADRLNDTSHDRRFAAMSRLGAFWELRLASRDLKSDAPPEELKWLAIVENPTRFGLLQAYDRGVKWDGAYVYCGTKIP